MTAADHTLLNVVRLARTQSVGPVTFQKLIEKHGSAGNAVDALLDSANAKKVCSLGAAERELEAAERLGMNVVFYGADVYPARLSALSDAPPLLYYYGDPRLFEHRACGIVGARNASGAGIKLTTTIASDLGKNQVIVVSGLARGIDTAAHTASFETGTIACLAGGLDVVYPQENAKLYERIKEKGLLVSEQPPGTQPQARHFPRRNRIISGLSQGVLIVEAAARSGSLITARYAAEQGRDLFVVPGSPLDPRSAGGNQLLKDGAILARNAEDILAELPEAAESIKAIAKAKEHRPTTVSAPVNTAEKSTVGLLTFLNPSPIHVDDIISLSGQSAQQVVAELQRLELDGKIARHSGGRFSRIE